MGWTADGLEVEAGDGVAAGAASTVEELGRRRGQVFDKEGERLVYRLACRAGAVDQVIVVQEKHDLAGQRGHHRCGRFRLL